MGVAFDLVVPVFGIIAIGYGAARTGFLKYEAVNGINLYVFNFAMPALMFRSFATIEFPKEALWGLWLSYYLAMISVWTIGGLIGRFAQGRTLAESVVIGSGAAQSNTIMLGLPIILLALGDDAAPPLFFILVFHGPILITLLIFLLEAVMQPAGAEKSTMRKTLVAGALGTVRNPIVVSFVAGAAYGQSGLGLPGPADMIFEMLGRTGIPCALFVLGATLTRYQVRRSVGTALVTSTLKLLVHPLLVWLLAFYVFGLPPLWTAVGVILAGMPTGIYSSIMATRYDAAAGAASSTVLLSTAISLVTITVLLSLFVPLP